MNRSDFLNRLSEIVEHPAGELTGDTHLSELQGWDSVAVISFIAMLDSDFNKRVAPRDIANCRTVDDLFALVGA